MKNEGKVYLVRVMIFNSQNNWITAWDHGYYVIKADNKLDAVLGLMEHPLYVEEDTSRNLLRQGNFCFDTSDPGNSKKRILEVRLDDFLFANEQGRLAA